MRRIRFSCWLTLWVVAACSPGPSEPPVAVFAAASTSAPFHDLALRFEMDGRGRLQLYTDGTARLVLQVLQGAPVDVLATADEESMRRALAGDCATGAARVFAHNGLAIVTAPGNPLGIAGLEDLAREELTVLLCGPEVPAGRYAREALARAGVEVRSASDEPSVRAVLRKVELGEADAGVVYATDAEGSARRVDSLPLPAEHDVLATYAVAVFGCGQNRQGGQAFVDFLFSAEGQGVLREHGFAAP